MFMYSLCSFHCTHIRIPSSKNVDIKHKRAKVGNMCFSFLWTYLKKKKIGECGPSSFVAYGED